MKRAILFAEWCSKNGWCMEQCFSGEIVWLNKSILVKETKTTEELYLIAESEGVFKELDDEVKQFLENFIENCENSERLDSVQTAYFCNWAKTIIGKDITTLPAEKNIVGLKIKELKEGE